LAATLEAGPHVGRNPAMTLVVNLIIFAGIVLLPLAISFVFMRLRRRFSSF
jgi:hypothetical protein